jgi:hypothetical protein
MLASIVITIIGEVIASVLGRLGATCRLSPLFGRRKLAGAGGARDLKPALDDVTLERQTALAAHPLAEQGLTPRRRPNVPGCSADAT